MEPVNVNGRAYDFGQISVMLGGNGMASASEVEYLEKQDKEFNGGRGYRPVSFGQGMIKANAALTLSMNDVEALRDVAPDGSLLKFPFFDVVVSYLNGQKPVTHVVKNCQFIDDGVEAKLDDKDIKRKFGLVCSHVVYR